LYNILQTLPLQCLVLMMSGRAGVWATLMLLAGAGSFAIVTDDDSLLLLLLSFCAGVTSIRRA